MSPGACANKQSTTRACFSPIPPPLPMAEASMRFPKSLAWSALWAAWGLFTGGCRAEVQGFQPPQQPGAALHWPVAAPQPLAKRDPRLWLALAAHLHPPEPLVLRSAKGSISLISVSGQRLIAPELVFRWQQQPLRQPLELRRQVWGPFASYESAQAASERWQRLGVSTKIAHPADWEVWAQANGPLPDTRPGDPPLRLWQQKLGQRSVLVVRGPAPGFSTPQTLVLDAPARIEAPGGLRWQGGVYAGPFRLQSDATDRWTLVEQVPLERYLHGVVPFEIGAGAPVAALQAQAVLARTWAVRNQQRFEVDGYHLCADTQCQVYGDPRAANASVAKAIAATAGQVLSWQGKPIHAVYHATNGGVAAAFEEGWGGGPLPYLKPALDASLGLQKQFPLPLQSGALERWLAPGSSSPGAQAYGADHPRYRWSRLIEAKHLEVLERGPSGRVLVLRIEGPKGVELLRLDAIRRRLKTLPSTLFVVQPAGPGRWQLEGGGFGHGAGLSQAGAIDLAARGWSLQRILEHYFPGASLRPLGSL
ncbi:SpoIID/LytB domain-containing protein [Cyanobium sp. WAJ14-Wanaka]|nr:SpoIID/LytB domain-containing protein [Cyanobium sp. WAJ14-Wanaka]